MRKSRFTEAQIIGMIKEQEAGLPTSELCRKHGLRNPTHPVSDSDNIRSGVPVIRSPRDVAAERGFVMSAQAGSV
uniref:transposase n=1 Tax=Cereibacter azotoformans TaxID=43057 RepID=UPI001F35E87F